MNNRLAGIDPRLYFITDSILCARNGRSVTATTAAAVAGGAGVVQIRDKQLGDDDFLALSRAVIAAVRMEAKHSNRRVPIVLNDRVAVARQLLDEGEDIHIHVGQDDMPVQQIRAMLGPQPLIGLSAANSAELAAAHASQVVDWVGIGPVFDTATKHDSGAGLGIAQITRLAREAILPALAIGGIDEVATGQLQGSGVIGVCVISAICLADDPEDTARRIHSAFVT